MAAQTAQVFVARPRAPLPPSRRVAAASRRLLAPPVLAAKQSSTGLALTKLTEPERRIAGMVMQGLLKQETQRDSAVAALTSAVKALERRVKALEQKLLVKEQKRQAAEQQRRVKALEQKLLVEEQKRQAAEQKRQAEERNRARQLNPACTAFWKSRCEYDHAPWNWDVFAGTQLGVAHAWPRVVKVLGDSDDFDDIDVGEWGFWAGSVEAVALRGIYDDDVVFGE